MSPTIAKVLMRLMSVAGLPGAPDHAARTMKAAATLTASQYPILRGIRASPTVRHIP